MCKKYSILLSLKGDTDYANYWSLLEEDREKYQVPNIEEGLKRLSNDKTVLHSTTIMLRGSYRNQPKNFPPIKTFGATESSYNCLIFTKNSPLVPIFKRASANFFERGQYERLALLWYGQNIPKKQSHILDTLVLSYGQVFLIFAILMASLGASGLTLIGEKVVHQIQNQRKDKLSKTLPQNHKEMSVIKESLQV